MRLINCKTELFEEYFSEPPPTYAILSHTWYPKGEITFQEYYDLKARGHPDREPAKEKLVKAIAKAKEVGLDYIWIDSCCIDITSSSELTEALSSMYKYYHNAERCLVYLSEFPEKPATPDTPITEEQIEKFTKHRWFERGWTLQELIAPQSVTFYNEDWELFGDKSQLAGAIYKATQIPEEVLTRERAPYEYSVAQRMSWAANRQTTREEDISYCLFGLFDVRLPLFYGEGTRKAFIRLQEAIMRESNDLSLFAWESADPTDDYRGALAHSPKEFKNAGDIGYKQLLGTNPEFSMTNKGLKIQPWLEKRADGIFFLPLNCVKKAQQTEQIGIKLRKHPDYEEMFCRFDPGRLEICPHHLPGNEISQSWTNNESIYITRDTRHPKDTSKKPPERKASRDDATQVSKTAPNTSKTSGEKRSSRSRRKSLKSGPSSLGYQPKPSLGAKSKLPDRTTTRLAKRIERRTTVRNNLHKPRRIKIQIVSHSHGTL